MSGGKLNNGDLQQRRIVQSVKKNLEALHQQKHVGLSAPMFIKLIGQNRDSIDKLKNQGPVQSVRKSLNRVIQDICTVDEDVGNH